ncbi:MAG: hypothetical protein U0610_03645 [bacterium]
MKIRGLRENRWDRFRSGLGRAVIAIGIAGIVIPILPGTPLLLLGAWMLGPDHPAARSARRWLGSLGTRRHPDGADPRTPAPPDPRTSTRWLPPLSNGSI